MICKAKQNEHVSCDLNSRNSLGDAPSKSDHPVPPVIARSSGGTALTSENIACGALGRLFQIYGIAHVTQIEREDENNLAKLQSVRSLAFREEIAHDDTLRAYR